MAAGDCDAEGFPTDTSIYEFVNIDDCTGFPTDTSIYEFITFDDCTTFQALVDSGLYEIITFTIPDGSCCCGECDCPCCAGAGYWSRYILTASGFTGTDFCQNDCSGIDGVWDLDYLGVGCSYATIGVVGTCDESSNQWVLGCIDGAPGQWRASVQCIAGIGVIRYVYTEDLDFCRCGGEMTLDLQECCGDAPPTILVEPDLTSTWISCGEAAPECAMAFAAADPAAVKAMIPKWIGRNNLPGNRPRTPAKRQPLPTIDQVRCVYRGDLVSECSGCGGRKPERHTYRCDHPTAEWDLCVPVPAKDVEWVDGVKVCRRCELREERNDA